MIVYCDTGDRAAKAAAALKKQGFAQVVEPLRRPRRLAAGRPAGGEVSVAQGADVLHRRVPVLPVGRAAAACEKGVRDREDPRRPASPSGAREMMQKSGRRTVPQIWIGERHVGGCDDLYALDREGKLDPLLEGDPMSEQHSSRSSAATFQIEKIYVKDLSLEIPNAPQVFMQQAQPQLEVQIDTEGDASSPRAISRSR